MSLAAVRAPSRDDDADDDDDDEDDDDADDDDDCCDADAFFSSFDTDGDAPLFFEDVKDPMNGERTP